MLFPINYTPVNDNGVATAAATATATAPVNGIVTTNSLNGNSIMEYSYGPTLHGRHESHPNQYVFPIKNQRQEFQFLIEYHLLQWIELKHILWTWN